MAAHHDSETAEPGDALRDAAHPRGTLVIMLVFGLFFGAAWLATYVFIFLARGAPHP